MNKQILAVSVLVLLVIVGTAAINAPNEEYKNLKILPKDISKQKMDSIMDSYTKALGIGCDFCHVEVKNFPDSLDYASDTNPMKENAREMMRMTIHINKTYFHFNKNEKPEELKVVNCKTCHRGEPYPVE
jgi:hypothetical protein